MVQCVSGLLRDEFRAIPGHWNIRSGTDVAGRWSLFVRSGAVAVVFFKVCRDVEPFELGGLDEIEKCLDLLGSPGAFTAFPGLA